MLSPVLQLPNCIRIIASKLLSCKFSKLLFFDKNTSFDNNASIRLFY